jgi:hypothetical protein
MNARGLISGMLLIILGLLAGMGYLLFQRPSPPPTPTQIRIQTNTVTQIGVRKINSTNYFLPPNSFRWSAIESTNYEFYIANLRSIDCPESTIRDIIVADVAGLYAQRRAALLADYKSAPFWKTVGADEQSLQQKQLRALAEEQRDLIRRLLQVDLNAELDKYNLETPPEPVDLSFLSPEKASRVQSILEAYRQRQEALHEQAIGLWSDADSEALQELNRQQEGELRSLLSPEEMEDYELRFSPLSSSLRGQLHGFSPTEEEFRRIFRLRQAYEETTAGLALAETDAGPEELDQVAPSSMSVLRPHSKPSLSPHWVRTATTLTKRSRSPTSRLSAVWPNDSACLRRSPTKRTNTCDWHRSTPKNCSQMRPSIPPSETKPCGPLARRPKPR